jgi:hypothetical protein
MQRESVAEVTPEPGINDAFFREGLVREFLGKSSQYHLNSGKIDVWYDSSGNSADASQTTAAYQPLVYNGHPFFDGSRSLVFPQYSGTIKAAIVKIQIASGVTPTDFTNSMYFISKNTMENVLCGFDASNEVRWFGVANFAHNAPTATSPMTIGVLGAENKTYSYTQYAGFKKLQDVFTSSYMQFSKFGDYLGDNTPRRGFKGEIVSAWLWDRDFTLEDFAAVASIANEYEPGE